METADYDYISGAVSFVSSPELQKLSEVANYAIVFVTATLERDLAFHVS